MLRNVLSYEFLEQFLRDYHDPRSALSRPYQAYRATDHKAPV